MTKDPAAPVKIAGRDMKFWLLVILGVGVAAMAGIVVLSQHLAATT